MSHLKKIAAGGEPRGSELWRGEDAVFTRFLSDLRPGRPLEGENFEAAWQGLRRLLVGELKRRSLWHLSPACLGIYGAASWSEEEAVEELVADAFLFVFGERLRSLQAHLRSMPDVEGLVLRSVRNFLHEAQKRHDPVGFRVFTVLRSAVRSAVAAGRLSVIAGSPAVRRDTVLAFHAGPTEDPAPTAALAPLVRAWNDELLPDLLTARGWEVPPLLARVEERLGRLRAQGIAVFRFQDLVEPLRHDVRARWRALGAEGQPAGDAELAGMASWMVPASRLEERESFASLLLCLERGIEGLPERAKSKEYLHRLQVFLRNYAVDGVDAENEAGERLPSQRRLADLLGIPRERLPGLFATLQKLVEACRRRSFERRGA
jgi:hypothetical protein